MEDVVQNILWPKKMSLNEKNTKTANIKTNFVDELMINKNEPEYTYSFLVLDNINIKVLNLI